MLNTTFKNPYAGWTDDDWRREEEAIRRSVEKQTWLEIIAACLRDDGLPALPQRRAGELATTFVLVLMCKDRYTIIHHDGELIVWLPEHESTQDLRAVPLLRIPLADPDVFKKVKEAIENDYKART